MFKFTKNYSNKLIIPILLIVCTIDVNSQESYTEDFVSPLRIPLFLSGNYGELRATHFHAGIDLKTQGMIGQPVYAAQEGYISRIKIQSGGYGHAIYITHTNGLKTVYGHLDRFNPEIQFYVEQNQYKLQKFEVDLYPPNDKFILAKGEQFAVSGNTGRSGGPHLHFEIRKARNDVPLNVLKFNFPIEDRLSPDFKNLYVYTFPEPSVTGNNGEKRNAYPVRKRNDTTFFIENILELENEFCGFGAEVYDFLNGSFNRCGIYSLELYISDKSVFSFAIDAISFPETRFINAHMDYALKSTEGKSVHRLFKLPNNELPIYSTNSSQTLFQAECDSLYRGKIIARDAYGNSSSLEFKFRRISEIPVQAINDQKKLVKWNEGDVFFLNSTEIRIPPGALYRDIYFEFKKIESESEFGDTISVHYETEPLQNSVRVLITPDTVPANLKSKMVIARFNGEELSYEGSEWENDRLTATTRNFGKFIVTVDTLAPNIVPLFFKENGNYKSGDSLKFSVTDNLSGLKSYNAYIDNQWVLLEYDAKNDLMFYTIDKSRLESGVIHSFNLQVIDGMNNISIFESKFSYLK